MLSQDLRYACRSLRKAPGFSIVAIITLSLGIGATTAMFSVVQAVLLRPLDYAQADRLVKVVGFDRDEGIIENLSPADFLDFQRDATSFVRMGAHGWVGLATIGDRVNAAERVGSVQVTDGFFATLQVQPQLGRLFVADDDRPDAPRVLVLSDGFWRRRFGADPSIIGSAVTLNATPATVIGVLPAGFRHLEVNPERSADVYSTYRFDPANANRGGHFIRGVARLQDGVTLEQARAELDTIAASLEARFPTSNTNQGVRVDPLLEAMVAESRPVLLLLMGAVVLVLLVACANVANLLLARGTGRMKEMALRAAIGADRRRLVRQMLTESAVLSVCGAVAGLAVAAAATRVLTNLAMAGIPRADAIGLDAGVLTFAAIAAMVTGAVFGLVPALHLSRLDLNDTLRDGGKQQAAAIGRGARELLIVSEVGLSIVLLIGAGLLIRSLWKLQDVDPGFSAAQVLTMEVSLPVARYAEGDQMPFYQRLEERIRNLPGVQAVGAINILPLSSNYDGRGVQIEDHPQPEGQGPSFQARSVTPGYFAAMDIPMLAGRNFDEHDLEDRQRVVIVSESLARRAWPGVADIIGKRITYNSGIPEEQAQVVGGAGSRVVVGVVGDVKHQGLAEEEVPMFYTPHTQQPSYHTMWVTVRAPQPTSLTSQIRGELSEIDSQVPLSQVAMLSASIDKAVAEPRMRATLLGVFAGLALLLAAIGVYGVVAYLVGQRTQEIGVRRALGAQPADVVGMLVRESMRPVLLGIVIGSAAAFAMTRVLASLLFEVSAADGTTYAVACGMLALAALLAAVLPARRALGVDPIAAVRSQ